MKRKIIVHTVFILFFSCNENIKNQKFIDGLLVNSYYNKGHNYKFEYKIENETYSLTKRSYLSGLMTGEFYLIKYDSLNPNNAELLLDKPVVLDSTIYVDGVGFIKDIEDKNSKRVKFDYNFRGKTYSRVQYLKNKITIGDKIDIFININNPKISYAKK